MKKIIFVFLILIFFSLSGCSNGNDSLEQIDFNETCGNEYQTDKKTTGKKTDENPGYETITADEAKEIMDTNPRAIILDVRTKDEYEEKHIPDSILFPNENINEETVSQLDINTDSVILIYCRSGNRSKEAASKLAELGYQNLYDFGGIKDWSYEVE
ncbi:MAG: rhodanese-like domain-containing protein [Aminipila sp.]